jgi:hypothetical protein
MHKRKKKKIVELELGCAKMCAQAQFNLLCYENLRYSSNSRNIVAKRKKKKKGLRFFMAVAANF